MVQAKFTPIEIEERLEELLGAVLSSRRTASQPAAALSELDRPSQSFALHWAGVIAKSNSEMAYQFIENLPRAFEVMDSEGVECWIIAAMDTYDRQGLYPGSAAFREVDQFTERLSQNLYSATFDKQSGILEKYLRGVSGRNLGLKEDQAPWTDTETLFLPESVSTYRNRELNFQLLKAMTAYLWAQTRFGTFLIDAKTGLPFVCTAFSRYRDPDYAQTVFEAVEEVRLLACMNRELPGLARHMIKMRESTQPNPSSDKWDQIVFELHNEDCDVHSSISAVSKIIKYKIKPPNPALFRGSMDLERVRLVTTNRIAKEKAQFQQSLSMIVDNIGKSQDELQEGTQHSSVINLELAGEDQNAADQSLQLTIDGEPVAPPPELVETAASVVQDFGSIPDEYLVPAGDGDYRADEEQKRETDELANTDSDGILYDEWDYRRSHYRKNWCVLREKDMHPGNIRLVEEVLERYAHLIGGIRKTFEVLRGDDRLLRKQKYGDDIDIEAVVESYVDSHKGMEMSDRLFTKTRRLERDLAVVFMVDVSGSTKGWINDAERESLILLCEALESLDDRYAIYGFSGMTRKRCELFRIKRFEENYDDVVKARIAGIRPQDYTRMGVIIRHLSKVLLEVEAKTKVLITLSDGKPDDYDGYRGEYGIEDTRQALLEVKYAGIHPFCITIDTHAHDYLPRMYGQVNYTVVDDVRKLPLSVSNIYRKLTS